MALAGSFWGLESQASQISTTTRSQPMFRGLLVDCSPSHWIGNPGVMEHPHLNTGATVVPLHSVLFTYVQYEVGAEV